MPDREGRIYESAPRFVMLLVERILAYVRAVENMVQSMIPRDVVD